MKKNKKMLLVAVLFLMLFAAFTAVVMTVDVRPIGPEGTSVGLATLNGAVAAKIGVRDGQFVYNEGFYKISKYLGILSLAVAGLFALYTIVQMICRKGVCKADPSLLWLMGFYVVVLGLYLLFNKIPINYRPVILPEEGLELSYPSSHTLLACSIFPTAFVQLRRLLKEKKTLRTLACVLCVVLPVAIVCTRLLSGVHWLTDILGSIVLSASLVCFYLTVTAPATN